MTEALVVSYANLIVTHEVMLIHARIVKQDRHCSRKVTQNLFGGRKIVLFCEKDCGGGARKIDERRV